MIQYLITAQRMVGANSQFVCYFLSMGVLKHHWEEVVYVDHEPEAVNKKRKTKDNEPKETTKQNAKRKCTLLMRLSYFYASIGTTTLFLLLVIKFLAILLRIPLSVWQKKKIDDY